MGNDELVRAARMIKVKYERHETTYQEGGTFEPLSVWSKRGYDVTAIEHHKRQEETMTHPVLGLVYRVPPAIDLRLSRARQSCTG